MTEHSTMVLPARVENGVDEFTCHYNRGVVCKEQYAAKCRYCGWNPENTELLRRRVDRAMREGK